MEKKVLPLTVSKQWFDMIAAGKKTEEYREIKPYWAHRLIEGHNQGMWVSGESYFKPYTHVLFINGYRKGSCNDECICASVSPIRDCRISEVYRMTGEQIREYFNL